MKNTIAALIAGLFATAAFAQTPAPTTAPDSSTPPAVAKAAAEHEKQAAKADKKDAKAAAKHGKTKATHKTKTDAVKESGAESTTAAATPATPATVATPATAATPATPAAPAR
jgi:hypothetical protein